MDAEDRANQLYWGSDESVNHIADELDLSKGALYEMIRPLPADLGCPLCGAEVVHSNRTARDRGRVDCPACGWDGTEEEAVGLGSVPIPTGADRSGPDWAGYPEREDVDDIYRIDDYDETGPPPAVVAAQDRELGRVLLGGALLGAAVGLALVIWARRE